MGPVAAFRLTASAAYEIRIYLINNDFSKSISVTPQSYPQTCGDRLSRALGQHWDWEFNRLSLASSFYDIGQ